MIHKNKRDYQMIEIALDENSMDVFLGKQRPVFEIKNFQEGGLDIYRQKARELITTFAQEHIIIVRHQDINFSINKFALALFIESCLLANNLECAVIKVPNSAVAIEKYKPYVSLCIGLKYAMRLSKEDVSTAYQEIFDTGYLGFLISKDYLTQTATFFLKNGTKVLSLKGESLEDALVIIGIMKAFSLAKLPFTIHAEFKFSSQEKVTNIDNLIMRICNYVLPYLPY